MAHHLEHTPVPREAPDPWHQHVPQEGAPQHEHAATLNPFALAAVFTVMVVGVVGSCAILVIYYNSYASRLRAEQIEITRWNADYAAYRATAESKLASTPVQWADATKDRVTIPINQAMERVASRYSQGGRSASAGQPTGGSSDSTNGR
jgi:hypothetical protein